MQVTTLRRQGDVGARRTPTRASRRTASTPARGTLGAVLGTSLSVALAAPAAAVAPAPPHEVVVFFADDASAALDAQVDGVLGPGVGEPVPGPASFGAPHTVHRFTPAFRRGEAGGVVAEPDATWAAAVLDADGVPVGVALARVPPGSADPGIATVVWSEPLAAQVAAVPAGAVLVHDEPPDAWFTLDGTTLHRLDGTEVTTAAYARELAEHPVGGAALFPPSLMIFQPAGIATVAAVVAGVVALVVALRRRPRRPAARPSGR